jgi:tetratricopeptide (TPR) repeat protein
MMCGALGVVATVLAISVMMAPRGRDLLMLYSEEGDTKHARVLLEERLAHGDRSFVTMRDLARVRAQAGDIDGSIDLLDPLARQRPNDRSILQTLADLYRGAHRGAELLRTLERLQALGFTTETAHEIARLTAIPGLETAHFRAVQAVVSHPDTATVDDYIELVRLQVIGSEPLRAWDTAQSQLRSHRLRWQDLPAAVLTRLAATALQAQRNDLLRELMDAAGLALGTADPILAVKVARSLGVQRQLERWLLVAKNTDITGPARAVELAQLLCELGDARESLARLRRAAASDRYAAEELIEIARLYIRLGRQHEGLEAMERIRQHARTFAADQAWALAATAADHTDRVVAWIQQNAAAAGSLPPALYRDLAYQALALPDGQTGKSASSAVLLAVYSAERLNRESSSHSDRLLWARSLLAADHPAQALSLLRDAAGASDDADTDRVFAVALQAAWRQGEPVTAELRQVWLRRLGHATQLQERDMALAALLEVHAYSDLVPLLQTLAEQQPQKWLSIFEEAAEKAGEHSRVIGLWKTLGKRTTLDTALRQRIAYGLQDAGEKETAAVILAELAANAPRRDPMVSALLFLWGPRPSSEHFDWIAARAAAAPAAEKGQWVRDLVERGAWRKAMVVVLETDYPWDRLEALDAALETVGEAEPDSVAAVLRRAIPHVRVTSSLALAVQLAERIANPELTARVLELTSLPASHERRILPSLALLAYRSGDIAAAERLLGELHETAGGDSESFMILGEIREHKGDSRGARQLFEQSLAALDDERDFSFRAQVTRADLLQRIGRRSEALKLYRALLDQHPSEPALRADYVALLMQSGDLRGARAVAGLP